MTSNSFWKPFLIVSLAIAGMTAATILLVAAVVGTIGHLVA